MCLPEQPRSDNDVRRRGHVASPINAEEADSFSGTVLFSTTAHGFATLEVQPRRLRIRLRPFTALFLGALLGMERVADHQRRRVDVYCAWLAPEPMFWRNTGVMVRHRHGWAVVRVPAWSRRRLLQRLDEAGFEVARRDTVIGLGHGAMRRRRAGERTS